MKSIIIFLAISLIANFFLLSEVYGEPTVYDDNYYIERFVGGLNYPTSMDFIGDGITINNTSLSCIGHEICTS